MIEKVCAWLLVSCLTCLKIKRDKKINLAGPVWLLVSAFAY